MGCSRVNTFGSLAIESRWAYSISPNRLTRHEVVDAARLDGTVRVSKVGSSVGTGGSQSSGTDGGAGLTTGFA